MIVYNITTKVHHSIDASWLQWQKEKVIPEIMETGCFAAVKLLQLLEQDDSEGKTYALQLTADTTEKYDAYARTHAKRLRTKAIEKWGDKIISFHSLLEVIH